MRWISEFDKMHTPENWIEDTLKATSGMGKDGKSTIKPENQKNRGRTGRRGMEFFAKAAAAVLIFTAVSTVGIYAHNYFKGRYQVDNPATVMDHFAGREDYTFDASQKLDGVAAVFPQQSLAIEATDLVTEEHKAVIRFTVTSGTEPLVYNDDERISVPTWQKFRDIVIAVDGRKVWKDNITIQRIDDAQNPYQAVFELTFHDENIDFTGKEIVVNLTDYMDVWSVSKRCGFLYDSVAELAKKGTMASDSDFTAEDYTEVWYADGSYEQIYSLNPGSLKIPFFSEYPDAYIDNMGFYRYTASRDTKAFYITVVPGKDASALQKLAFKNEISGDLENTARFAYKPLPDGRIQICLSADRDRYYSKTNDYIYQDTTLSMLENYTLALNNPNDEPTQGTRFAGTWQFTVQADAAMVVKKKTARNVEVPDSEAAALHIACFNTIKLTATELQVTFDYTEDTDDVVKNSVLSSLTHNGVMLIMKDGTKLEFGEKMGGGFNTRTQSGELSGILGSFVNTNDVVAIEFNGYRVDLN